MGLAYTLIAAPCASPIFFGVLASIQPLDQVSRVIVLFSYGLGAGVPFIAVGAAVPEVQRTIFKQYRFIAPRVKYFSSGILLFLAFYLIDTYYFPYYPLELPGMIYRGLGDTIWSGVLLPIFVLIVLAIVAVTVGVFVWILISNARSGSIIQSEEHGT